MEKKSRRGRGLETFEVCNYCEDAAVTTHCPQTLSWPGWLYWLFISPVFSLKYIEKRQWTEGKACSLSQV